MGADEEDYTPSFLAEIDALERRAAARKEEEERVRRESSFTRRPPSHPGAAPPHTPAAPRGLTAEQQARVDKNRALALERKKQAQGQPARLALGQVAPQVASARPSVAACAPARGGAGKENAAGDAGAGEGGKEGSAAHVDDDEVQRRRQLEREVQAREDRLLFQENEQRMAREREERALEQQRQEVERESQEIKRRRAALERAEEEVARAREEQQRREQEQARKQEQVQEQELMPGRRSRKRRNTDEQDVVVIADDDVVVIEDDAPCASARVGAGRHSRADAGARPEHWQASSEHVACFEVLPGSKEHAKVTSILQQDAQKARSRGAGVLTDAFEVAKLERIQNNIAWATYSAHKSVLVQKGSDPKEVWAVHGECVRMLECVEEEEEDESRGPECE